MNTQDKEQLFELSDEVGKLHSYVCAMALILNTANCPEAVTMDHLNAIAVLVEQVDILSDRLDAGLDALYLRKKVTV